MAETASTDQKTQGKIGPAVIFSALLCVFLIGLLYWLPEKLLTQRYFHNIFILRTVDRTNFRILSIAELAIVGSVLDRPGGLLLLFLVAGVGVVAAIVDLFCSGFIDTFDLTFAFLSALIGVIMGWALRWRTLVNVMANIFDPKVDWANHLFRFSLFVAFFGFIAFAAFMSVRYSLEVGSWHRFLNPVWPGQPYVACLLWGWFCSYFVDPQSVIMMRRYNPPNFPS